MGNSYTISLRLSCESKTVLKNKRPTLKTEESTLKKKDNANNDKIIQVPNQYRE